MFIELKLTTGRSCLVNTNDISRCYNTNKGTLIVFSHNENIEAAITMGDFIAKVSKEANFSQK